MAIHGQKNFFSGWVFIKHANMWCMCCSKEGHFWLSRLSSLCSCLVFLLLLFFLHCNLQCRFLPSSSTVSAVLFCIQVPPWHIRHYFQFPQVYSMYLNFCSFLCGMTNRDAWNCSCEICLNCRIIHSHSHTMKHHTQDISSKGNHCLVKGLTTLKVN